MAATGDPQRDAEGGRQRAQPKSHAASQSERIIRRPCVRVNAGPINAHRYGNDGPEAGARGRLDGFHDWVTLEGGIARDVADTHRAANAVAKLQALMPLLPTHAQAGIANAFSHVTATHRSAVAQLARDTTTPSVGRIAKNQAAADIEADVTGQAHALTMLNALVSSLPPSAQQGIQTAIAAIQHNLAAEAARLTATKPHAPRRLRPTIAKAAAIAKSAA